MAEKAGRDPQDRSRSRRNSSCIVGKTREAARERYRQSQMHKHLISLGKSTLKEQKNREPRGHQPDRLRRRRSIEKAMAFKKAGVTHFLGLYFAANSVDELVDQMQMFAEEVDAEDQVRLLSLSARTLSGHGA